MQILTHFISIGQHLHQAEIPNYVNNVASQLRQFENVLVIFVIIIIVYSSSLFYSVVLDIAAPTVFVQANMMMISQDKRPFCGHFLKLFFDSIR